MMRRTGLQIQLQATAVNCYMENAFCSRLPEQTSTKLKPEAGARRKDSDVIFHTAKK